MFDRIPDKVYIGFVILLIVLPLIWFLAFLRESQRGYWYGIEMDVAAQAEDAVMIIDYSWPGTAKGVMVEEEIPLWHNKTASLFDYKKHHAFIGLSDTEYYCYPSAPSYFDSALLGLIAERAVYRFSEIVAPENLIPAEALMQGRPYAIADYCRELYQVRK